MSVPPDPRTPDRPPADRVAIDGLVSIGFLLVVVFLAYRLFHPLIPALLWGGLLATIAARPYERLVGRLAGRRRLADVIFGLLLVLVLLLPVLFFSWRIITALPAIIAQIEAVGAGGPPALPEAITSIPTVGPKLESAWQGAMDNIGAELAAVVSHLGGVAGWVVLRLGSFGAFMAQFVLGGVISLFLLHHRFAVRSFLARFVKRVGGDFAGELLTNSFETTRNAFSGVVVAAICQTALGTLALWLAGLPALAIFAGFTFILAIVQIGPLVVLIVACSILAAEGSYGTAGLLVVWFALVVMSIDNLIRPYFTSHGTGLPGLLAFLGTVGGLLTWGLIGVFVGPVLASVLYRMLLTWVYSDPQAGPGTT